MSLLPSQQAVDAALQRSARGTRSRLERIPNELRLLIINELPDVSSIINLALTGPDFYLFIEAQANNAANHVISTVGEELLPFAATLQGLDALGVTLPGPLVHDDSEPEPANPDRDPFEGFESRLYKPNPKFWLISTVLDRYINYRNMRSCHAPVQFPKISTAVHYMGFYKTSEYIDFHEVVEYWEQKLVSRALERAKSTFKVDASIEPTRSERTRFRKALYVLHLVSTAFPYIPIFESDEFYAWQRMWIPFAPWETEQVRCIHLLLADYFRDILTQGAQDPTTFRYLSTFILTRGLKRLRVLDTPGQKNAGKEEFRRFHIGMSLQSNFLTVPVPWQLEAELLSGTGPDGALVVQQKTFIDATKVFFQYPEDDCGPMSAWYHPLVHQYSSDPILEHAELRQFACHTCMPLWGYVFWDYETLSVFGHQPLISIDEMLRAARGISVDSDKLFQDLWNRSHLGYDFCECPIHRQADGCLPVNGW